MKLTKEDIKKYGTLKEQSQLNRAKLGDLEYYFESIYNQMDWDMGKAEIIKILRNVYEDGWKEGYDQGWDEAYDVVPVFGTTVGKDW